MVIGNAVSNQIKRRRGSSRVMEEPISLKEQRAVDKANVMELLKDFKHLLTPFDDVLATLLATTEPKPF